MKYTDFYKFDDKPRNDSVEEVSEEVIENDSVEEVIEEVQKDWVGYVSLPGKNMTLNLRSEPNSDSEILTTLKNSTELIVSDETNAWYKVFTSSGIEGYVMKEFVKK